MYFGNHALKFKYPPREDKG